MRKKIEKLRGLLKENPDPSKWSKWLKFAIKILVLALSAVLGDEFSVTDLI